MINKKIKEIDFLFNIGFHYLIKSIDMKFKNFEGKRSAAEIMDFK
jgi:hypothetical protein